MTPDRLDPLRGSVRGLRAAVLTVPAVGSAALGHGTMHGCDSAVSILAAAGLCWPAAVMALGARRRVTSLLLWLVAAQVLTHVVLEALCTDVLSGQVSLATHLAHSTTAGMAGIHLAAAGVSALLLGRADAGLWTARALLRAARSATRALRVTDWVAPAVPDLSSVPTEASPVRRTSWTGAPARRRGPPGLLST